MTVSAKVQERFDALLQEHEITHPGQYLIFKIEDGTYAVGPSHDKARIAYKAKYGEGEQSYGQFLGNTIKITHDAVKPGVYRHFKGNTYHVLGVVENTETKELTVVYIPQMGPYAHKLSDRDLKMFLDYVEGNKDAPDYKGPRFTLVEERHLEIHLRV